MVDSESQKQTEDFESILNEIESLQNNIQPVGAVLPQPLAAASSGASSHLETSPPAQQEGVKSKIQGGEEQVLQAIERQHESIRLNDLDENLQEEHFLQELTQKQAEEEWLGEHPVKQVEPENLLKMSMQGKMAIQLNYDSKSFVRIGMDEFFLWIQLSDGMELKIPQPKKNSTKQK